MFTYDEIKENMDLLVEEWGDNGKRCIELALAHPLHIPYKEFLESCTACGGNWGGMLLSGINRLRPEIYEAIPDNMGHRAFIVICAVIQLLGVDTKGEG
jgi:hypothetical protein